MLGTLGSLRTPAEQAHAPFSVARALVVGSVAGLVGGWAFGQWMAQVNFFIVVAGLMGSETRGVGAALHYVIAAASAPVSDSSFNATFGAANIALRRSSGKLAFKRDSAGVSRQGQRAHRTRPYSLGISPEERDRIEKAGQGEGLLVTTGQRVWVNLYGHPSPGEFSLANTDALTGIDVRRGQNSSHSFGRNEHAAESAAYL